MVGTAALTLLALAAAAVLAAGGWGAPVAVAHLAFAVGIVPLVFAAISHFVPVLTRTSDAEPAVMRIPPLAQVTGVLAVLAMQGFVPRWGAHLAALADLLLAAFLLSWVAARVRRALGAPHPGWRWYGVAIGCLMLALLAILAGALAPAYWRTLRTFHLHLNTLGFVGIAALGTLPVLLPTALGKADPDAAGWLRRRLWLVAGGVIVLATGAAVTWPFAAPGAAVVLVVGLSLLGQWLRRHGWRALFGDGVCASLAAALCGLVLTLGAGVAHGSGLVPARPTLEAWVASFLLPLVTGALAQLLPVWRWPGNATAQRAAMRTRLAAGGAWRALMFLGGGAAMLAGEGVAGATLAGGGLLLFALALAIALRVSRSTG